MWWYSPSIPSIHSSYVDDAVLLHDTIFSQNTWSHGKHLSGVYAHTSERMLETRNGHRQCISTSLSYVTCEYNSLLRGPDFRLAGSSLTSLLLPCIAVFEESARSKALKTLHLILACQGPRLPETHLARH